MFRIHLYENDEMSFPEFPSNSYETNDLQTLINELQDLFNNHDSGIARIVIENSEFAGEDTISYAQSIMNLDR